MWNIYFLVVFYVKNNAMQNDYMETTYVCFYYFTWNVVVFNCFVFQKSCVV